VRIAWIVYGPWGQRTGGYLYDEIVVDGLRARGDDVEIVELPPRPSFRGAATLPFRLRRAHADVIVGDELCFREIAPAFALERRAARVLLVHHPAAWESPGPSAAARLVERAAMRVADAIVTTSEETAGRMRAEGFANAARVVEPGADRLAPRAHRPFDPERVHLLFLGSVVPRKRVLELLDAFEAHAPAGARLSLAGSTRRDPSYAARIASRAGVRVSMLGEVDDQMAASLLADADALVLPSALEGFGIVLLEALHAGTPAIAARTGAAARILREGRDGLTFEGASLGPVLARFFTDAALRRALREGAAERAATLPTWASCVERFREALSAAHRRGRARRL
jgi:glycosyltransferase involved in cell wall biosynthesis